MCYVRMFIYYIGLVTFSIFHTTRNRVCQTCKSESVYKKVQHIIAFAYHAPHKSSSGIHMHKTSVYLYWISFSSGKCYMFYVPISDIQLTICYVNKWKKPVESIPSDKCTRAQHTKHFDYNQSMLSYRETCLEDGKM